MPSSDPTTIPKILDIVAQIDPTSILDIGPGNGRYGFLFRECLDWNYGRMERTSWEVAIDSVEVDSTYITDVHRYVYDHIIVNDWLEISDSFYNHYSLAFLGDVLEHFGPGDWQAALMKAQKCSDYTLIAAPNYKASVMQDVWHGHVHEKHRTAFSPSILGGKCLFANSKLFITCFDNIGSGILEGKNVCL